MKTSVLSQPKSSPAGCQEILEIIATDQSRLEKNSKKLTEEYAKFSDPKNEVDKYQKYLSEKLSALIHDHYLLSERVIKLDSYIERFSKHIKKTKISLAASNGKDLSLAEELKESEKQLSQLIKRHAQLEVRRQALEVHSSQLQQETVEKNTKLESFLAENTGLDQELLDANNKLIEENKSHIASMAELSERYKLVSGAISSKVADSQKYQKFTECLDGELIPFINKVSVLPNEAELVIQLKAIQDQLYLLESLGGFKDKSVVAVSGGFSSGKSSFITSLFSDHDIQLPIGIEPVTAIPTYVLHGEDNRIVGFTNKGGEVEIAEEIYKKISHEYIEEFGFNFRDLMPFIVLETPIPAFDHVSFIDLPGYNPGVRQGYTGEDKGSAEEYMAQAQYVMWVIGLDANGTVSRDDIDFLVKTVPPTAELYIIINKADLRPPSQLSAVMEEVSDMLYMEGIEYVGISSYSSVLKKELDFIDEPLFETLARWNKPRNLYQQLHEDLKYVFAQYIGAFEHDLKNRKEKTSLLKAVELDLFELGAFDEDAIESSANSFTWSVVHEKKSKRGKKNKRKLSHDKQIRVEKIATVRMQLVDLRRDYNQELPKSQLKELHKIRESMLYLLEGSVEVDGEEPSKNCLSESS